MLRFPHDLSLRLEIMVTSRSIASLDFILIPHDLETEYTLDFVESLFSHSVSSVGMCKGCDVSMGPIVSCYGREMRGEL